MWLARGVMATVFISENLKGGNMSCNQRLVEVCVDSLTSALNAQKGGADRLEICQNLQLGGTTPSYGLVKAIKEKVDLPLVVMVRPRAADFCYNEDEYAVMLNDIALFKTLDVSAIVTGILTPQGALDKVRMAEIIKLAAPTKVVLHRAFDMTHNLNQTLKDAAALGIVRVLTSGGARNVKLGMANLKMLFDQKINIEILPGSGVDKSALADLVKIGAKQIHLSGKVSVESVMQYRRPNISMSSNQADDYQYQITETVKIKAIANAFKEL